MNNRTIKYSQAISEALTQGMQQDPNVFIFGLGVDDWKGIFGTTRQAFESFGSKRVFDVPASENALTGIAIGAALNGKRPVLVHARNDFMFLALDQMMNNAAKWKYTYDGKSSVPFVTRGIIGKGWGQGPTHSQSLQSVFAHFPGLYVAMPSTPYDIKGLFLKSFQLETPVVMLEHRSLYDIEGEVPEESYTVEFGKARVLRPGEDVTIVATAYLANEALQAADLLADKGIRAEVIDPVTIQPMDEETIVRSVKKTGYCVVADTSWSRCGVSSDIAAFVQEQAFDQLKGPVRRIHPPESPCPVSQALEKEFYRNHFDIVDAVLSLVQKDNQPVEREDVVDTFMGPY